MWAGGSVGLYAQELPFGYSQRLHSGDEVCRKPRAWPRPALAMACGLLVLHTCLWPLLCPAHLPACRSPVLHRALPPARETCH